MEFTKRFRKAATIETSALLLAFKKTFRRLTVKNKITISSTKATNTRNFFTTQNLSQAEIINTRFAKAT